MVSAMLKASAHQKSFTWKCGCSSHEHSSTIRALMTKVNRPSVRMLMGRARSFTIGLMHELIKPSTMATITAHHTGSTVTPSSMSEVMKTASAETISLIIITVILGLNIYLVILNGPGGRRQRYCKSNIKTRKTTFF